MRQGDLYNCLSPEMPHTERTFEPPYQRAVNYMGWVRPLPPPDSDGLQIWRLDEDTPGENALTLSPPAPPDR